MLEFRHVLEFSRQFRVEFAHGIMLMSGLEFGRGRVRAQRVTLSPDQR